MRKYRHRYEGTYLESYAKFALIIWVVVLVILGLNELAKLLFK